MRTTGNALGKQVYLYSFDSVRNTKEEIEYAQRQFYQMLVYEGVTVVLTLNQITDSIAFLSMVRDPKSYDWLMELFELGVVKVSRFGNTPSAASFVKSRLKNCLGEGKCATFVFSALPIRTTGKRCDYDWELLEAMYTALDAADPSYLQELLYCRADGGELDDTAQFLLRYVRLLLRMSMAELASNPAKERGTWITLEEYIQKLMALQLDDARQYYTLAGLTMEKWITVQQMLTKLHRDLLGDGKNPNSRSDWYVLLKEEVQKHPEQKPALEYVEGIVDFAYNMSNENSITNISAYYTAEDSNEQLSKMFEQLGLYLNPKKNYGHCFLQGDPEHVVWPQNVKLANLKKAVRILKTTNAKNRCYDGIPMVEEEETYRKKWGNQICISLSKRFIQVAASVLAFLISELIINMVQESYEIQCVAFSLIQLPIFCALESVILKGLEYLTGVDDLDALYLLMSVGSWCSDFWTLHISRKWYFRTRKMERCCL
jgi:hypothetical protein